jgi:16S rRNA (uracil1498-N3)-methyltransferase
MRLHRFMVDAVLAPGTVTVRDPGLRNQLANVLRLAVGDAVVLCDGRGTEANAAILGFAANATDFAIDRVSPNAAESAARVTLYCAVLKRENFEIVVQKATEAGAARIVPVVTRRTVKTGLRLDRLGKIAKEAAEQSGRGILPVVAEPLSFKDALADAVANRSNVLFELGGRRLDARSFFPAGGSVGVWIGPEGGWDDDEVAQCREKGFVVATLGPRTLRAETAAVVATFLAASSGDGNSQD